MPAIGRDTLAFLQYTSGSTGAPRGVMVSHANLIHNSALIYDAFTSADGMRSGGWLPLYHDMGLIGQVLNPIYGGGTATLMSPSAFLRNPFRWLDMIHRYDLRVSGGPNFAFDLCVRRLKDEQIEALDLSGWEVAFNGAEPVRAETMRAFAARLAPAGFKADAFYPCYGMAETTLLVAGRGELPPTVTRAHAAELERGTLTAPAADERTVELVSSGRPDGLEVVVVDPATRTPLPDGTVGELWIRGASVARGYWREAAATSEVFRATTADGDGPFVRSGDLGTSVGGELYVTGRRKEIVIVNGRNLYPQDIEHEVREAHPALAGRTGAAFSLEATGERLVVIQELSPAGLGDAAPEDVVSAVKQRLAGRLGLRPGAVVLVAPRTVLRTTSGKIQRRLMRSAFVAGALEAVHTDLHPAVAARMVAAEAA
jgi:acyl-CoA synthetase (AMP-forming)/AMP-acid ligase II